MKGGGNPYSATPSLNSTGFAHPELEAKNVSSIEKFPINCIRCDFFIGPTRARDGPIAASFLCFDDRKASNDFKGGRCLLMPHSF